MTQDTVKRIIVWPVFQWEEGESQVNAEGPERSHGFPLMKLMLLLPRRRGLQPVITQEHLLASGKGHRRRRSVPRA